jgi:hypothetical protein
MTALEEVGFMFMLSGWMMEGSSLLWGMKESREKERKDLPSTHKAVDKEEGYISWCNALQFYS